VTDKICPIKCKLFKNTTNKPITFSTVPGQSFNWTNELCPYGYHAQGTVRDPRTSSGICTAEADHGQGRGELEKNCTLTKGINPTCTTKLKKNGVNPYVCCDKNDDSCTLKTTSCYVPGT
jgi:hypothetical protein